MDHYDYIKSLEKMNTEPKKEKPLQVKDVFYLKNKSKLENIKARSKNNNKKQKNRDLNVRANSAPARCDDN